MTANRAPTADELNGVKQDTVQWPAKAHRVYIIGDDGSSAISKEGNFNQISTSDENSRQLLNDILIELKKVNLHLSILSDNNIKDEEVE